MIKLGGSSCTAIETAKQRVMEDQCSPTASLQTSVVDAQDSDTEWSKRTPVLEHFMPLKRRWEKQTESENNGLEDDGPDSRLSLGGLLGWEKPSYGLNTLKA
jgi:hypothetical protein